MYAPPSSDIDVRPRVIVWYRAYAGLMFSLSLLLCAAAMFSAKLVFVPLTLALAAFYGIGTFVPMKPWGWRFALVVIALGMTTPLIVVTLPLFLGWNKPLVKAAFRLL